MTSDADQTLEIQGCGEVANEPVELNLTTVSLDKLATSNAVLLQAQLAIGDMPIRLDGTLTQPFQPNALEIDILGSEPHQQQFVQGG